MVGYNWRRSQTGKLEFLEGGLRRCMYACISIQHATLGGSGGMLPQEIFRNRCSEIASEAILGQNHAEP